MQVPNKNDWGEYWRDVDINCAFDTFFGKTNAELQSYYFEVGSESIAAIRFIPENAFSYYIFGVRDFIEAGKFPRYEAADFVSYFIAVIEFLLINEKDKIETSIDQLLPTIIKIGENQEKYDATIDIYGNFKTKSENIVYLRNKLRA